MSLQGNSGVALPQDRQDIDVPEENRTVIPIEGSRIPNPFEEAPSLAAVGDSSSLSSSQEPDSEPDCDSNPTDTQPRISTPEKSDDEAK